ncbi:MAG: co-chaperone DjlA [Thiohalocapsa sp.]
MGWLGKVVGGLLGFAAGGPIGAVLGATLGHGVDRGVQKLAEDMQLPPGDRKRIESVFFTATFATMGHLAKSDGRVSAAEIALAEAVMARLQLTGERRSAAIALFRQGKAADFDLRAVVERFRRECLGRRTLVQLFLEIQLQAAYVDGEPSEAKRRVLEEIREGLRIPQLIFRQLENIVRLQRQSGAAGAGRGGSRSPTRGPTLGQAYSVLGVSPKDNDAVIKRAYRRLMSQHHPDKLVSKGVPEDMIKLATQKTQEIRRAYEMIQDARAA